MDKMSRIKNTLKNIFNECKKNADTDEQLWLDNKYEDLMSLLSDMTDEPEVYFDLLGTGSFKATYDLSSHWVIKFGEADDTMCEEAGLYAAAQEAGIGQLLPKTFYVIAPDTLEINSNIMADDWDDMYPTDEEGNYLDDCYGYENRPFRAIVIQEKVGVTRDTWGENHEVIETNKEDIEELKFRYSNWDFEYDYDAAPRSASQRDIPMLVYVDNGVDNSIKEFTWFIKNRYGDELVEKWEDFKDTWEIYDIHWGNWGFKENVENPYNAAPVVFDWLTSARDERTYDRLNEYAVLSEIR